MAEGRALEGVGGRPRSFRWVGVRGMSSMASAGAQKGRRELLVAKTRRRRIAFRRRDSRLAGKGVMDLWSAPSAICI